MRNDLATYRVMFRDFAAGVQIFTDSEWEAVISHFIIFEARRKDLLTTPGEVERYLYFVVEGVQRVYYLDDQDREATLVFTYAPSFGGVIDAMVLGQPAKFGYETLTPSVFLRAPYREIEKLRTEIPALDHMFQTGVMQALSGILDRLAEVQCFSSEDRFRSLMSRSPHLLRLIPHKYIANYLGIDPTNFSKLINRIKI